MLPVGEESLLSAVAIIAQVCFAQLTSLSLFPPASSFSPSSLSFHFFFSSGSFRKNCDNEA
jgi:hypothetical protein